jgi:type 1 glutamine amidotransferase
MILRTLFLCLVALTASAADAPKRKVLFFTKSSGYEHEVISCKKGQPSFAEKQLLELGAKHGIEFVFSKDGSKFSPEYLAQFDTVMFYTTGDLCSEGADGNPPMSVTGKQALFDFVKSGKGFVGTHSAADTFHTDNESLKGPERFANHGDKADAYVCFLGAEFIRHGKQQAGVNKVIDKTFPGFGQIGDSFSLLEEWYTLKDFRPEIHVLTTFNDPPLEGDDYKRPPFPNCWARLEGKGRVFYTAMGHREDVWTHPIFQEILAGALKWANGDAKAPDMSPNLLKVAPGALTNQPYTPTPPPKPKAPAKPADAEKK